MNLIPIFKWDKTLLNLSDDILGANKLIVKSEDIEIKKYNVENAYKGFDLKAICRYEELAEINVNMGDYKNAACSYIDYFEKVFTGYEITNQIIDKVITWNNVLSFRKIPFLLAKKYNIPTMVLDYSAFRNRLIIDNIDTSIFSNFYNKYVTEYRYQILNEIEIKETEDFITKYKENQITRIPDNSLKINDSNYSLVILQVQNDANILYYQSQIINNETILKYLQANLNKKYLIRNHPLTENKNEVKKYFNKYRFVDDYSLHSLLENCNEVITINSSVGIEALCYNKPVICLGNSVYNKIVNNIHFLYYYIHKFTKEI